MNLEKFTVRDYYTFDDLIALTAMLRAPDGCPWDSVQNHSSVRRNFIEEVYEVCEAIDQDDPVHMCEELGDVLYQVLFHADLEREAGRFTINEVIDGICKKLVARHPFLFAQEKASTADDALDRWDNVKRTLNGQKTHAQAMDSISRTLPALWRAEKLYGKAEKAGVYRENALAALDALEAEVSKLRKSIETKEDEKTNLGNTLFAAVDVARLLKSDPEEALNEASERFIRRFEEAEANKQELTTEILNSNSLQF